LSSEYNGEGSSFFAVAEAAGLEGIVSKKKGSRYIAGVTDLWVKTKAWETGEFDVIGVKRGNDNKPYALFASGEERVGSAIVSLPNKLREQFWLHVEAHGSSTPSSPAWREKNVTWLPVGMRAVVRYLRSSTKLRHASIRALQIRAGEGER
jgi:bifunctional non-homologous end joining protein LigD